MQLDDMQADDLHLMTPIEVTHNAHTSLGQANAAETLAGLDRFSRVATQYPSYYIVRGECLVSLGRIDEARESLKQALKLSPNSARPALLLESLYGAVEIPAEQTLETPGVERPSTEKPSIAKPLQKAATLAALFGDHDLPRRASRVTFANQSQHSNFDLGEIASLLTRERPLVRPTPDTLDTVEAPPLQKARNTPLVSETLAGILLGQGKLKEALEAYEQLLTADRDREEYYQERIHIIRKRMKSGS